MHIHSSFIAVGLALASSASAQFSTVVRREESSTSKVATATAPATTTTGPAPTAACGVISASQKAAATPLNTRFQPSLALECLESIPLDKTRAQAFIDYIIPFLQFQSTITYLAHPPQGWTLPGVDIFGGLNTISENIKKDVYKSEWAFEKDLYIIINVLPRDFHTNMPLPLIGLSPSSDLFTFNLGIPPLVSVSLDGESLPQPYLVSDMNTLVKNPSSGFKPSAIKTINGEPATEFLLRGGLENKNYQDPDTIYNLVFSSLPLKASAGTSFTGHGYMHGFGSDTVKYTFENGTSITSSNFAVLNKQFTNVSDGAAVYSKFVKPTATTSPTSKASSSVATRSFSSTGSTSTLRALTSSTRSTTRLSTGTSIPTTTRSSTTRVATPSVAPAPGFPVPVVQDSMGLTAGYFLKNSDVAVLDITSFSVNRVDQVGTIRSFLDACKAANKKHIIVDLQGDGGGFVSNGYDAFEEFFPTVQAFGARRSRYTPLVDFISNVSSTVKTLTGTTIANVYNIQTELDLNLKPFTSSKALVGPVDIDGDKFTTLSRSTFSNDPLPVGTKREQVFNSLDIVLLHDGGCGSTCALFSQFMKQQGRVRAVAVGGRAKTGPMQGVTGSKGAQVLTYSSIVDMMKAVPSAKATFEKNNIQFPTEVTDPKYAIPMTDPPLGGPLSGSFRFNLRNNYNSSSNTEHPLQFTYEATNCRIFFQPTDLYDITGLWSRVANVTWGSGKCVPGSSVNKDNTINQERTETVPFGPDAVGNVTVSRNLPGYVEPCTATASSSSPKVESCSSVGCMIASFM
ncbi:hypothetical protein BGZ60DRAFT_565680 [Tricladium varicosporioides]|nr:hypothetical protein BGZ60DRAFT_565680 [Hymenoscyphus varicosporioides]